MSSLLRQVLFIHPRKPFSLLLKSPGADAFPDPVEEAIENMVIVNLKQHPPEHLLRDEEMLDVGAMVVCAGVAGAVLGERGE